MSGLRWGVLSTASIARVVTAANPGRFRAVAGRDRARTAVFASETGIERTFDGYAAMLAGDEIDAVYIPLHNALHTEWTIAALEAGKHVLCEKPFAPTVADAARCFDVAEAHGRVLAEGFMWRLYPQTLLARQLIADGAIGRPGTVRAALRITTTDPNDIRRSPTLGGGALGDLGCYCVSAIRLFAGEPERLTAEAVYDEPRTGHEDSAAAEQATADGRPELTGVDVRMGGVLRGANGTIGVFDCALDLPRADELEIIGSEGVLQVPDPWLCGSGELLLTRKGITERVVVDPNGDHDLIGDEQDAYRIEFDVFQEVVAGERPHPFGRADALAQAATLEAIRRSARSGRAVTL